MAARQSDFQSTVTMMISPLYRPEEIARFAYTDGIVGRLGDFPELTQAVRSNDLEKVSILCEGLFRVNSTKQPSHNPIPIAAGVGILHP